MRTGRLGVLSTSFGGVERGEPMDVSSVSDDGDGGDDVERSEEARNPKSEPPPPGSRAVSVNYPAHSRLRRRRHVKIGTPWPALPRLC